MTEPKNWEQARYWLAICQEVLADKVVRDKFIIALDRDLDDKLVKEVEPALPALPQGTQGKPEVQPA